jgi:hypothetical protein
MSMKYQSDVDAAWELCNALFNSVVIDWQTASESLNYLASDYSDATLRYSPAEKHKVLYERY